MADTDFDVIFDEEIVIEGLELDVVGSGDLPILDDPADPSDVRSGKQYINQNGNKVTGSGEIYEIDNVTPTEEPITINADTNKLGISKITINPIPEEYLIAMVEGETLIMSRGTIEGEVLEV